MNVEALRELLTPPGCVLWVVINIFIKYSPHSFITKYKIILSNTDVALIDRVGNNDPICNDLRVHLS